MNLRAMKGRGRRPVHRIEERDFYAVSRHEQLTLVESYLTHALEEVAKARRAPKGARSAPPLALAARAADEARRLLELVARRA